MKINIGIKIQITLKPRKQLFLHDYTVTVKHCILNTNCLLTVKLNRFKSGLTLSVLINTRCSNLKFAAIKVLSHIYVKLEKSAE